MVRRPLLSRCAVCFAACALLVSGCTSQYGERQVPACYHPQCCEPIQALRDDENAVAGSTAAGTVAGGAAGAIGGNVYGRHQQKRRDAREVARYADMPSEDAAGLTRVTAARAAHRCYMNEYRQLVADWRAGRLTMQECDGRYREIRSGLQEVSCVLNGRYEDMTARDREYEGALAETPPKSPPRADAGYPAGDTHGYPDEDTAEYPDEYPAGDTDGYPDGDR